jgi:hypothetical protein
VKKFWAYAQNFARDAKKISANRLFSRKAVAIMHARFARRGQRIA